MVTNSVVVGVSVVVEFMISVLVEFMISIVVGSSVANLVLQAVLLHVGSDQFGDSTGLYRIHLCER